LNLQFFKKQEEFAAAVFSGDYRYLLYGGAIRGGKSFVVLGIVILLARLFPRSRWAVVRKDLPTLRRNTIPTIEALRPRRFMAPINKSTWVYKCANGSEILIFPESHKQDPDLDRWKGLEVNGFVLEEANELSEGSLNKAIERAGSWKIPDMPPPLILATCNPARNWVKRLFYDPWKIGKLQKPFFYLPAKITDNPHIHPEYLASLEQLKVTDEKTYNRFVLGDWDQAEDPSQLIAFDWLLAARSSEHVPGKKMLGVDVARFGEDDTVIAHREGNTIKKLEYFHGMSVDRVVDLACSRIMEGHIDADNVRVDGVGLGAGVVDGCRRVGFNVFDVQSGARPLPRENCSFTFANLRSQLWWEFREAVRRGEVCLDVDDPRLIEDLTAPRYSVTGDRALKVESKDEIKKRIGRSTDAADAVIYAWADLSQQEKAQEVIVI